jgi:ABC-type transporter Mla subunit MlaD
VVTQSPKRSAVAVAVGFVLSCVALIVLVWTQFGGTVPFAAQGYRLHALFKETGLLVPNADVRISGVNVGKVVSVQARGVNSFVTIDIRKQYAPIPIDTRAILRQKTLLGEAYVMLSAGSAAGPKFGDGGTIPTTQIDDSQQLDQVLGSFDKPTQTALQNLLNGTFTAIAGRGQDLGSAVGNLDPAVNELTAMVNVLNDQQTNVQRLIDNTGTVLTTLGDRSSQLQNLISAGGSALSATAQRNAALTATVNGLPAFLTQLRTTLSNLDTTLGLAAPALHVLRPVARLAPPALRDVIRLAGPATQLLQRAPGLLDAADHALPAIARFTVAVRPAFEALLPAVREVAPMMAIAGEYRHEILAAMANLGAVNQGTASAATTNNTFTAAGTAHYVRVVAPLTSESIGGQSIRPPTNRHNPYYAPGEQANLATGLLSSDCNDVHNVAQVPFPGARNVPCRLQPGYPWGAVTPTTRNGYFPHLTRAPVPK